jgi:hypothetical protein
LWDTAADAVVINVAASAARIKIKTKSFFIRLASLINIKNGDDVTAVYVTIIAYFREKIKCNIWK